MVYRSRSYTRFAALCALSLLVAQGGDATKAHSHKHAASVACTQTASPGDAAVGIKIVSDSSCASGGVGCIDTVCRFCKTKDTIQSSHLVDCGAIGSTPGPVTTASPSSAPVTGAPVTSAPSTASPSDVQCATSSGDYAAGIQGIYDASCSKGGLGCASTVCRHCKWKSTSQSSHLNDCSTYVKTTSAPATTAPATATPASTSPPVVTTEAPQTFNPSSVDTECPWAVSDGDYSVGIQLVGDATCASGGVGCFQDVCRYCMYKETAASKHLKSCLDLGFDFSGEPYDPIDDTPTTGPSTPTSAPATGTPGSTNCAFSVSPGDAAVGIQLVGDASCAKGGVGCYENVCRYCKVKDTPQSSHMVSCKDLGYDPGATAGPATEAPVVTTGPPKDGDEDTGCPFPITDGDYAVGIQLVGDASCISGGVGCYEDICRYCKYAETPEASHLFSCVDLGYTFDVTFKPTEDDTPAPPTDAPVVGGTGCEFPITEGDYAVGIQLVGDESCANGGVGCYEGVCRYCKYKESAQSSHLLSCKNLGYWFGDDSTTDGPTTPPTTPPTAFEETRCPFPVSEGDYSVGIQLVGDATCASGGVGCYEGICRYCKYEETKESSHLMSCKDLGFGFTPSPTFKPAEDDTPAPTTEIPGTGCAFAVTEGDYAVGIQLVGDESCVWGGLGCHQDVCRYCKYKSTAQSGHLLSCKSLGYDFGGPDDDLTPEPTTAAPPTAAPTPNPETDCVYPITEGDYAVGIQLVGDKSCADGGVGCYEGVCRYCKYSETAQSKHLLACVDLGYEFTPLPTFKPAEDDTPAPTPAPTAIPETGCPFPVTKGDYAVGIHLVGDATCASGGIGCFENVCRYCKYHTTPQSSHLIPCKDLGYDFGEDVVEPTSAPTPTPSPTPIPDPIEETGCPYPVSEGDLAVGIQLVGDAKCADGGVGCYEGICRYCKYGETEQSSHLTLCSDLGYWFGTFKPTDDSGSNDDGSDATEAPAPTTAAPVTVTPAPTPVDTKCAFQVSDGDKAVGIQLVGDAACASGGLGCFADVCRFCKVRSTSQSAHLLSCKDLGFNFDGADAGSSPTAAPTPMPAPIEATGCPYPVSGGDFAVGIQLVGDATCANGGLGCYEGICRYCKHEETAQSAHLLPCSDFGYPKNEPTFKPNEDITPAPTPATPIPSTGCAYPITEGDYSVGIQLVGDATCANGGVGCYEGVCRYCQYKPTDKSSHLTPCSDLGYDFGEPTTPKPTDDDPNVDPSPLTCPLSVSEGDFAVGIQLVTDASCANGGLGCLAEVCRFCKYKDTPSSTHLLDCASFGGATPQPSTPPYTTSPDATPPAPATCAFSASEGDLSVGINVIPDASCAKGGLGCFADVCRYCRTFVSDKSSHLEDCSKYTSIIVNDVTEEPETPAPTPYVLKCESVASEGDKTVGIDYTTDMSCFSEAPAVGCIEKSMCRFCKRTETAASSHLEWCPAIVAPTAGPSPATGAPGPATTTSAPATATPSTGVCSQTVSSGDASVGIDIVADASCPSGVGCIDKTQCRFCKRWSTPASSHLSPCPSSGGTPSVTTNAPGPVVTTATPDSTVAPPPSGGATCSQTVSSGDAGVGIDIVADASCPSGVGCIDKTQCRFCKRWDTPASSHLAVCPSGPTGAPSPTSTGAPGTITIVPGTVAPGGGCTQVVSDGDAKAGISILTDASCLTPGADGTGCIDASTCRLCKKWVTAASGHLNWCPSDGAAPDATIEPPPSDATPAPTLSEDECALEVSEGDFEGGIDAQFDPSCSTVGNDNTGCFGGVCRYCKFKETEISSHLFACVVADDFTYPPGSKLMKHKAHTAHKHAAKKPHAPSAAKKTAKKPHAPPAAAVKAAAAVKSVKAAKPATSASEFDELLKDKTFKWALAGAGCVGVAAVLALFALGAKRVVARRSKKAVTEVETAEVVQEEAAPVVEAEEEKEATIVAQV